MKLRTLKKRRARRHRLNRRDHVFFRGAHTRWEDEARHAWMIESGWRLYQADQHKGDPK